MTTKEVVEFERKLHELLERKPPGISASKIKDLTRIAMTSPKQYKNIVYSVQKFIQRCSVDYKLGALYVLDSISQAAARQKTLVAEKDDVNSSGWSGAEYLERFEKVLEEMFSNIMQCPEYDKDKVKRVLDIWISKDGGIYSKEVLQKIKEAHFQQRTTTNDTNGDHHTPYNPLDQTTINPATLDSSALLATLNNLTQGTLNIPSFLSSQAINSAPMQPNTTIPYNNNVTMPVTNITSTLNHQPSMSTMNNGYMQPSVSSYNPNVNSLKGNNTTTHDPLEFDYGDMDEADDAGLTAHGQNNDKNNAEKSLINNVLSVNAAQAATSTASTTSMSQFNQDQFNLMANQLFAPSQNIPPISVAQPQIPPGQPQQIQQPSVVPNTTSMPSIPPFQYQPPPQSWAAPGQQPQQIPPGSMPPPPEHYQPPPFQIPPWTNQQNIPPPQQWNPNGPPPPQSNGSQYQIPPNQASGQQPPPFQSNPPPPGFPNQPPGHQVPPGQPLPPPGHHVPPPPPGLQNQPPMGHPIQQGQPVLPGSQSGQPLPPPGHQLPPPGHHIPQPQGQTGPNQQQIQTVQTQPQQPQQPQQHGGDVCVAYEDQNVGRDVIKVLSRTLYVGSVMEHMTKQYIEDIFAKHGPVSTVTLNYDKNHGFVKMETRAAAARALRGVRMKVRSSLKVRWGVGFGPKDCFDFPSGESLIPLSRLTETDRKWLITSKCGGTGGRPVVGGVVVEEPDIVIGEGFSSGSANKKIGPLFESPGHRNRRDRDRERDRDGYDLDDSSRRSSESRKFSDASWEGSASPVRRSYSPSHRSSWSEKVPNLTDQKYSPENPLPYTFPQTQSADQTPPQQHIDINSTNSQQDNNNSNNNNQRNETSSISSPSNSLSGKKREREQFSADRDEEHYRENVKKSRWD